MTTPCVSMCALTISANSGSVSGRAASNFLARSLIALAFAARSSDAPFVKGPVGRVRFFISPAYDALSGQERGWRSGPQSPQP